MRHDSAAPQRSGELRHRAVFCPEALAIADGHTGFFPPTLVHNGGDARVAADHVLGDYDASGVGPCVMPE